MHPKIMQDSDSKKHAQTPSQAERVDRYQVCSTRETPSLPWNAEKRIMQPNIWKDKASREEKSEMNKATRGRMRGMKSSSLESYDQDYNQLVLIKSNHNLIITRVITLSSD
jgi:hypothetical protein